MAPFPPEVVRARYQNSAEYRRGYEDASRALIDEGFLLSEDATELTAAWMTGPVSDAFDRAGG
ncbi:alpha/beta hydrolase domain-containing protein [Microbacterium sp. ARD32]|uniref:alpha/beta hydrolase domain-containing protein n=1 Tax=Microbacterium sp. ARD32 TaxID=2962577 RepID=UPI0037C78F42